MFSRVLLSLCTAACLFAPRAVAQDDPIAAMRIADDVADALNFLAEDARFLADGAIQVGDTAGWQRYTEFSTRARNVAWDYEGYSRDLGRGMSLRYIDQQYSFNRQDLRALDLAFSRLRYPPGYFEDRFHEFTGLDREFQRLITTAPDNPNNEPDVPGRHECTATWSMNGLTMSFRGQGDSRNRAKAAALAECQSRAGRFCQITSCRALGFAPRR